jgi:hypothetical protein
MGNPSLGHSLLLEVAMQNVAETVAQLHPWFYILQFPHLNHWFSSMGV